MVKTEPEPIRSIFVVDDHPLTRAGIRQSID
ncbi:MAG TPA: DNA-binding response regulator, partial [Verrucomicrobiales bacterium]|nr:DNA-binding response regulator [Verrucomicrobiales bacterium]